MLLKITVFCVATFQLVPFANSKSKEIVNDKPQLLEKRKDAYSRNEIYIYWCKSETISSEIWEKQINLFILYHSTIVSKIVLKMLYSKNLFTCRQNLANIIFELRMLISLRS